MNIILKKVIKKVKDVYEYQVNLEYEEKKLLEFEDSRSSRRCKLIIDGIPERPREMWKQCNKEVTDIIINKLGIVDEVKVARVHLTKSSSNKSNKNKQSKPSTVFPLISGGPQTSAAL